MNLLDQFRCVSKRLLCRPGRAEGEAVVPNGAPSRVPTSPPAVVVGSSLVPRLCLIWVPLVLLVAAMGNVVRAQTPEERLGFEAAVRTLESGFAEKAAADFASFIQHFPKSPLAAQAILLESRARLEAGQLDVAAEKLGQRIETLGALKDQAYYLLGDINVRRGRFDEAAQAFRRVAADTPKSPLAFKAAFSEALSVFRAGKYAQAADLLSNESEHFARLSTGQSAQDLVPGRLLLAEAQLRANQAAAAKETLTQLEKAPLTPPQAWERAWLVTSLGLTNRQLDVAIAASSNLLALATATQSRDLIGRSQAFRGDILRQAGRTAEAFAALTNNLSADTPAEWRRDALLAIVELPLNASQVVPAIELLSRLTSGPANDPTTAAARIAVAELYLQHHFEGPRPGFTNALIEARKLLQTVLSNAPPANMEGRAWFDLGWTELARRDLPSATAAFERASSLLPPSILQALAFFKLADCQQQAGQHGLALTNYLRVIRETPGRPPVRGAVLERALYQGTLAAIEAGQQETALDLARRAVEAFPNGEFRDETRLLYGQTLARLDPPTRAREALQQLGTRLGNAPVLPEIQLAVARSYLREGMWSNALHQLDDWTRSNPNHAGIAQAEFWRAWSAFKTGNEARAYSLFTSFLARFPNDPSAPKAQVWVGNYLHRLGGTNYVAAEASYQLVFQRTNWPVSRLTYEARLLAGRAAFARQGYTDAKNYFRWLITNGPPAVPNSPIPADLVARAYFALGDCFIEEPEPGDRNLENAQTAFAAVIQHFPQSREAMLARGKLADCYFQSASLDRAQAPAAYAKAAEQYLELMKPPADVAVRSEAEVSLGIVREKQAERAEGLEAAKLLNQAMDHYLNVFHGKNLVGPGEVASPFWVNRAGIEAARLAEAMREGKRAAAIYDELASHFPASAAAFRARADQLRKEN